MKVFGILVGMAYPFLIYAGLRWGSPRILALLVAILLVLRVILLFGGRRAPRPGEAPLPDGTPQPEARAAHLRSLIFPIALVGAVIAVAAASNDGVYFLFMPILINAALLVSFGRTLLSGPSMIETFARLQVSSLSDEELLYCRRVTFLWCAFFVLNGAVTYALALFASLEQWTFYTGFLAYLLIGALFLCELIYRKWRFRRYEGAPTDLLFRRIFPPRQPLR